MHLFLHLRTPRPILASATKTSRTSSPHPLRREQSMGKLYVLLAVGFASTLLISSVAAQYLQAGEAPCPAGGDVASLITQPLFELMLKHRNDPACNASNFYTYEAFIAAATAFDGFGTTGDLDTRKRELAAFFAQTSHETTGWWDGATDGRYAWGYCLKEDGIKLDYCVHSPQWPCAAGKQYYGRGPMKLYFNYNYGPAGKAIGVDLLNNPELVATDPVISFKSAVWYWMTPQPPTKPSCHDAITGAWTPSAADQAAGRVPGFGITTNILVGELECGHGTDQLDVDRVGFYKAFTDILGVSPGDNVDCNYQDPFGWTERPYLEK